MSEINGVVKEIFEGQVASGRNAGEPFWSITLEETPDEKITCFSAEEKKGWIEGLEQGREYTFTVKVSGKYINIAGQTVPCEDVGEETEEVEEKPRKPVKIAHKRKPPVTTSTAGTERVFKNRISALQAAVQYVVGSQAGTATDEDLMEYAETFFDWINNG